jgi:hypothetical protein
MKTRLWLLLLPLAVATATYVLASPRSDTQPKIKGSVISRAVETFDREGVAYGFKQLGGQEFGELAKRLGHDERSYYDIGGLKFGGITGKKSMTDEQLIALAEHIAAFPKLTSFDMRGNEFSARGIASIPPLPGLTEMRLGGPTITDAIVEVIERFPALTELQLENTSVTDTGVEAIEKRLPSCNVTVSR